MRCAQYLCNGLEDDIADRHREMGGAGNSELERMVNASGKMVLLHKLLPKLRAENRKVGSVRHCPALVLTVESWFLPRWR